MRKSTLIVILVALIAASLPCDATASRQVDLGEAVLVLPDELRPRGEPVPIILHMHGAPATIEKAAAEARWIAPVLLFNRKGLSSVYTEPFRDPRLFPRLLDKTQKALADIWPAERPQVGRVFVSTFSAGFGGLRELLAVPEHFARIDGVILADSLYAGYAGDPAKRQIDPAKMVNFRKFAAEAAAGRKLMVVTHSAQIPPGYASTTETADDLIGHVGGKAEAVAEDWGDGWQLKQRYQKGRLLVLGFAGEGPDDHLRHLRRLGKIWLAALELDRRPAKAPNQASRAVTIPIDQGGEVHVAAVIARLAEATGVALDHPVADLPLSTRGLARGLTTSLFSETLGSAVAITFQPRSMVMTIDERQLGAAHCAAWRERLERLAGARPRRRGTARSMACVV